jgi:hypothetical protein
MRNVHRWMLPTALVLVAACGDQADAPPAPSVSVVGDTAFLQLPVGRSADNGELSVAFDGVSEDSRCPVGVQCARPGNGAVRLTLTGGGETRMVILNSTLNPRRASFGPFTIGFLDLTPYPVSGEPFDREEYAAHLSIVDTR